MDLNVQCGVSFGGVFWALMFGVVLHIIKCLMDSEVLWRAYIQHCAVGFCVYRFIEFHHGIIWELPS